MKQGILKELPWLDGVSAGKIDRLPVLATTVDEGFSSGSFR
jgi:hypothetical protein